MTASGSHGNRWEERTVAEETMTAEGEMNDLVVESSHGAVPANSVWRTYRGVVSLSRVNREDNVLRDDNREGLLRSDEGQSNGPAVALDDTLLDRSGEGGPFRRIGKNDHSLQESCQSTAWAPPGVWAGRKVSTQWVPCLPLSPSQSSQASGGWRPFKGDYSGPRDIAQSREHPSNLDLNVTAPAGDAVRTSSSLVPDFNVTRDALLDAGRPCSLRYDPGRGSPPSLSAEQSRLFVSRTSMVSLFGSNISPDGLAEGVEMRPNSESSCVESHELLHIGGTAEVDGHEAEIELLNRPLRAFGSTFQGPEKLHKRARFVQVLSTQCHPGAPPLRGSSPSSSSSRPDSPSGLDRDGQPPFPTAPLPAPSQDDERELMESENAGEDGEDGEKHIPRAEMEDGEVRMDLTDDLLHKVFSFLDDTSLCQAAMVCKQWRVASAHEDFWKTLNFEGRHVTHEQVGLLCVRYPKATTLNLRGAPCVDEMLVREAMRSLRNLEVLTLSRGFLSDGFFYALAVECCSLQNLSISDAVLGNGGAQEIQLRHESLRRLQIYKCRVLRIAIRCPQLDCLSLKRTGTASAMLHCPRLVNLDVSSCHKLSDAGVRAAATACPLLASLDMSNCAYVSDETLREISMACTNLRSLDASYCPNISLEVKIVRLTGKGTILIDSLPIDKSLQHMLHPLTKPQRLGQLSDGGAEMGVRMPMLIELKLQGCEGVISSSMTALATCAMLEDLALDFCWLLTAISLDLPRLRQISLTNNRKFVELTLRSPALTKLNLVNCPILNRVDITSSSLQSLVLRQQNGLSSMALQCIWLREVDLSECENITDAVCEVFSDGGGCPRLRSLILDSCEGLIHVKLAASSLQSLSLVGCRNIISLEVVCPVLQQLHLDGCDHLTEASFGPVGLLSLNLGICPHLVKLQVEASKMTTLDLRGCGVLSQAIFRCPSLMSLDASYCSQLGDDCLDETTSACPAIQSLVLASCPSVGPVGLLALKRLRDLTTLDLSYTFLTDLSPIFEACPGLKVLRLSACKYLGDRALDALHGGKVLPELRELDLSYGSLGNSAVEGVMALCPHLSHVSLNGCAHVTDLLWARLSSPALAGAAFGDVSSSVDMEMNEAVLSDVGSDSQQTPGEQAMDIATSRDKFSSGGCTSLLDRVALYERKAADINPTMAVLLGVPVIDSARLCVESETTPGIPSEPLDIAILKDGEVGPVRALQNLSCVGCPHIKKVVIPRFAACLHLSSLNLSLSVNIREVQLSCANLTSLNLSNCAGLVVLKLDCPRLLSLFLQACGVEVEMLEQAVQGCDLLETLDVRSCTKVSSAALAQMRLVCPGLKRLYSTMSA